MSFFSEENKQAQTETTSENQAETSISHSNPTHSRASNTATNTNTNTNAQSQITQISPFDLTYLSIIHVPFMIHVVITLMNQVSEYPLDPNDYILNWGRTRTIKSGPQWDNMVANVSKQFHINHPIWRLFQIYQFINPD